MTTPMFMSATIDPLDYFVRKLGLSDLTLCSTIRHESEFPMHRRKLFIVPQLSSLFRLRTHQVPKIAEAIAKILCIQKVNTFVFAPSFRFALDLVNHCHLEGEYDVHLQEARMTQDQVKGILQCFDASQRPQVLFAVMRGSLSEGVDLPGNRLESVIVVGPALPKVSLEQSLIASYEESKGRDGFDQASIIPAMIHVNQSMGRLIRSPDDAGTCFLLDRRFVETAYFSRLPPDWRRGPPETHVSKALSTDIMNFWREIRPMGKKLSSASELG
jgi:Rad3-related DNA helicase